MSCLALQPHLLSKVVVPGQSLSTDRGYTGVFHARFWLYGDWIEVRGAESSAFFFIIVVREVSMY